MKKTYLLKILFIFILFSCSENEIQLEDQIQPNPSIISQYHKGNHKFYFDEVGNISKYRNSTEDFEFHYVFDDDYRLVQVVKKDLNGNILEILEDITYDVNGKVSQINDRTFFYSSDENIYYENQDSVMQDGELLILDSDVNYSRYYYEDNNPTVQCCAVIREVELPIINEYCSSTYSYSYGVDSDGNLSSYGNDYGQIFDHSIEELNPLYFPNNIRDILGFLITFNSFNHHMLYVIANNNFLSSYLLLESKDFYPEYRYDFYYEYNTLDLPVNQYANTYNFGVLESEDILVGKFYYQGDIIPE